MGGRSGNGDLPAPASFTCDGWRIGGLSDTRSGNGRPSEFEDDPGTAPL
jgi:hypothetical protein